MSIEQNRLFQKFEAWIAERTVASVRNIRMLMLAAGAAMGLSACGEADDQSGQAAATGTDSVPPAFSQCKICHSLEPGANGIGPSLAGFYRKPAAQEPSFAYSPAIRQSGLTWDAATLDAYLKAPRETVPGTTMSYTGLRDDAARAELVEWLKGV